MAIQIGTAGLIRQQPVLSYTPSSGWRNVERYIGDYTSCQTEAEALALAGYSVNVEPQQGGKAMLYIQGSADRAEQPYTWSIVPVPVEVPILTFSGYALELSSLYAANHDDGYMQMIAGVKDGTLLMSSWSNAGTYPALNRALKDYAAGRETDVAMYGSLRKTVNVYASSGKTADHAYYMRQFTTAQMTSYEAAAGSPIPSVILGTLPSGDWLKQFGGVEPLADGRYQIAVEYHFRPTGGWNTDRYPVYA